MAVQTPQLVRINKKIGTDIYTLYHPQTGTEFVLHSTANGSPWPTGQGPTEYNADGTPKQTQDPGGYVLLSDVLSYIITAVDSFGNVLEFKGTSSYADLPTASTQDRGEVYIVTEKVFWRLDTTKPWVGYPANTLFVITAETKGYINDTDTGNGKVGYYPLGSDSSLYALKSEAVKTIVYANNALKYGRADESGSTNTIVDVATSVTDSSSSKLVTEGAVYNYAASAGKVKVTAASEGYLIGVATYSSADSSAARAPLDFNIHVTGGKDTTPTLGANISGNAATASKVEHKIYFTNTVTAAYAQYDGNTSDLKVTTGDGLRFSCVTGSTSALSIQLNVNTDADFAYVQPTGTEASLNLKPTGIVSGTYSALQVDAKGRALAGAQAVVFANSTEDPDLNQLVIGGLAFISSSETSKTGTVPTNNIDLNN